MCPCSPCCHLSTGITSWKWASTFLCSSASLLMSNGRWVCRIVSFFKQNLNLPFMFSIADKLGVSMYHMRTCLPVICMCVGLQRAGDSPYSHNDTSEFLLDFKLHPYWNPCYGSSWLYRHTARGKHRFLSVDVLEAGAILRRQLLHCHTSAVAHWLEKVIYDYKSVFLNLQRITMRLKCR